MILHVTEETLLRGIIPAVTTAGHGLTEIGVLDDLTEFFAYVVTALIAVILNSA